MAGGRAGGFKADMDRIAESFHAFVVIMHSIADVHPSGGDAVKAAAPRDALVALVALVAVPGQRREDKG